MILLVRASPPATPAQDPMNRILWALPKGTVQRGLGWGGGRGSGRKEKEEDFEKKKEQTKPNIAQLQSLMFACFRFSIID